MAFREVALDNKCVTQVLRGDANSAEVSYIAPENFSMKDCPASDDEFETMGFSSLEPESQPHITKTIKIAGTNKSPPSSDKISRYQGNICVLPQRKRMCV